MRVFVLGLLTFVNYILQTTWFDYIRVGGIAPNTALILVVCYGILRGDVEGMLFGFSVGILQDIFFGRHIGYFALIYSFCGFIASRPFRNFYKESYFFPMILVGLLSAFNCLAFYVAYIMFRSDLAFQYYLYVVMIPEVLYTTGFSIIFYWLMYQINKKLEEREENKHRMFES